MKRETLSCIADAIIISALLAVVLTIGLILNGVLWVLGAGVARYMGWL